MFKILMEIERCADPIMSNAILQNRNEFQQAPIVGDILGFLGPNVFMVSIEYRTDFNVDAYGLTKVYPLDKRR